MFVNCLLAGFRTALKPGIYRFGAKGTLEGRAVKNTAPCLRPAVALRSLPSVALSSTASYELVMQVTDVILRDVKGVVRTNGRVIFVRCKCLFYSGLFKN